MWDPAPALIIAIAMAAPGSAQTVVPEPVEASQITTADTRIGSLAPKIVDSHIARRVLEQAESRRIDIVSLGDSNQLFFTFGWQDGWSHAMGARFEMYATPILGSGEDDGIGMGVGVIEHKILSPIGAPAEWNLFNDPASGVKNTPYGFLDEFTQFRPSALTGMMLRPGIEDWPSNNFDETAALRFHFSYGVGPGSAGFSFEPGIIQLLGDQAIHPPILTENPTYEIASGWIDYPQGKRSANDIVFHWFRGNNTPIHGPFFALYMRVENLPLDHGFSNHTLYGTGGASARQCATELQAASDEQLIEFFTEVRDLQPAEKMILIRIAFGGNDRTDALPSVGPSGWLASNTPEGVEDNHLAIINRIKEIWQVAGWDESELTFLLVGNHAKSVEPAGFGFRNTISNIASYLDGVAFVNLAELADPLEMSTNGWYSDTDAHLSRDGYRAVNTRELSALLDLPEDLNGDCVVDTADLGILLGVFGQSALHEGLMAPDFNFDDVIDTADLGRLIAHFGLSCPQ